ncbi:winged helix-turn-helix domain-containing protein [Pseudoalteromonas piscicida]|uniref:winged helix-turn-helix domain-containing protein n=1 Tax=Pseudoalteromonas piscicida TaxID=43662 RepID=UPI001C97AA97|nr:winged helix-turn-helix domain-containing protein [Pseudoalteromonas piscicida]QZO15084.1 winged helix-turn-helix domain-containing protein [Pseudoalteromonas piscicida]
MITINNRKLDLATGELIYLDETIKLEAKVLAVFEILYQHRGTLVTQEHLLNSVWQNTVVAPNALQRCIAQLRKLLGDSDKRIIQTFHKKGYRLQVGDQHTNLSQKLRAYILYFAAFITLFGMLFIYSTMPKANFQLSEVTPVSYGLELESTATLTSGRRLLYVARTPQAAELKVKDLDFQTTKLVTRALDFVGKPQLNKDGKKAVLIETRKTKSQAKCHQAIVVLPRFAARKVISPCLNSEVQQAYWVGHQVLLIANSGYALFTPHSDSVTFTSLPITATILASSFNEGQLTLLTQDPDKEAYLSSYIISRENELSLLQQEKLSGVELDRSLVLVDGPDTTHILSTASALYIFQNLQLVQTIPAIGSESFYITEYLKYNNYLATQVREQKQINIQDNHSTSRLTISHYDELSGQFQPSGNAIAFLSNRTGTSEVWLKQEQQEIPLTHNGHISSFIWTKDGKQLWAASKQSLLKINLVTGIEVFPALFEKQIIMQSIEIKGSNYLLINDLGNKQLVLFDPVTNHKQPLYQGQVHWAQIQKNGTVYIATPDEPNLKVLVNNSLKPQLITDKITLHWRFYLRGNELIIPDKQATIWRYNVNTQVLDIVGKSDEQTRLITDVQLHPFKVLADSPKTLSANQVKVKITEPENH